MIGFVSSLNIYFVVKQLYDSSLGKLLHQRNLDRKIPFQQDAACLPAAPCPRTTHERATAGGWVVKAETGCYLQELPVKIAFQSPPLTAGVCDSIGHWFRADHTLVKFTVDLEI